MKSEPIPPLHQAIAQAAVKALLGEHAVIREMQEVPAGPPLRVHISALGYGIRTFWSHWTGRHTQGSAARDETED
jgi:hypothetical protein